MKEYISDDDDESGTAPKNEVKVKFRKSIRVENCVVS